jgi:hypothetical protein
MLPQQLNVIEFEATFERQAPLVLLDRTQLREYVDKLDAALVLGNLEKSYAIEVEEIVNESAWRNVSASIRSRSQRLRAPLLACQ